MSKNLHQNAEDRSVFLFPTGTDTEKTKKGERADITPFRAARLVDIDRIKPDPNQPKKHLFKERWNHLWNF